MKALSLHQPYAQLIAEGHKTLESRTWHSNHVGDLLICATKKFEIYPSTKKILKALEIVLCDPKELHYGCAICVVDVYSIRRFEYSDDVNVLCAWFPGGFVFELANVRKVKPVPVTGRQRFFEVDDSLIEYL
jgi:hypothetical protein